MAHVALVLKPEEPKPLDLCFMLSRREVQDAVREFIERRLGEDTVLGVDVGDLEEVRVYASVPSK